MFLCLYVCIYRLCMYIYIYRLYIYIYIYMFFFFFLWEHRTGTMCPFSSLHPLRKGKEV